jgi:small neutral amino acid transporter SnatA (MarC family)
MYHCAILQAMTCSCCFATCRYQDRATQADVGPQINPLRRECAAEMSASCHKSRTSTNNSLSCMPLVYVASHTHIFLCCFSSCEPPAGLSVAASCMLTYIACRMRLLTNQQEGLQAAAAAAAVLILLAPLAPPPTAAAAAAVSCKQQQQQC